MRLAFVSPMPPAPTGVADYSSGLAAALARKAEIHINPDDVAAHDAAIYQIGNNPLHLPAYRAALARPGIAVLHDAVLHHLLLGTLTEPEYLDEFAYNYGEWMRELGLELWRSRSHSAADARYFQYPMLRRVVERSLAVIVHNPAARRMALEAAPAARVTEVPHYFAPPRLPGEARRTRDRLGIAPDEVVIATFGFLRESKRISSVLKATRGLRRTRYLLVGRFVSPDLECALQPLLGAASAIRMGYVPEEEFWRLAEITDICVNLRSPSAGETSGITVRMMGIGKPVVVTDNEENASFPDLSVVRTDPGEAEVEMLEDYLRALAASEDMRRAIGARAAQFIAEKHTLERAAEMYLELAADV